MSNSDRIGIYLTDQIIVLADSNRGKLQRVVSNSLESVFDGAGDDVRNDASDEIKTISYIQKHLREQKISPGQICFSIPIQEIFLRSFLVPWMSLNELNNAVYYEAKKYLPFDLKLLEYIYQPVIHLEGGQKKWRIIFYAVRKQTLEQYDRIVKQIGGKALVYEPALVSLAKQLITKNYLRIDQSTVVVYIHETNVHIIFYEKGVAYFVRDFSLPNADIHDPKAFAEVSRVQLLREIRKSLGYYASQFSEEKIKEILVLSTVQDAELTRILTDELALKVRTVEPSVMVGLQKFVGMEILCATGSCLDKVSSKLIPFNFLHAKSSQQTSSGNALAFDLGQILGLSLADFKYALQAFVLCSLLLGALFYFSQAKLQEVKRQNEKITQNEGKWLSSSVDQIKAEIKGYQDKVDSYKKIQSQKTNLAAILAVFSKSLPKGVWLENIKVSSVAKDHLSFEVSGYVYFKEKGGEYRAINEFLDNLRANKYFTDLGLNVTSQQKRELNNHTVLAFIVTGN